LKAKKTLSSWLTTKYLLIIRNEENLAEKTTLGFTYAKLILLTVSVFIMVFVLSLFLVQSLLSQWFDPRHAQIEANKMLYELAVKVDSLAEEDLRKARFIYDLQRVLRGDTAEIFTDPATLRAELVLGKSFDISLSKVDSQFRANFEQSDLSITALSGTQFRELQEIFFFSPLTGFVSDRFDVRKGHYGVDVVSKKNEPVKCIADGTVIMASWTQDAGYVIAVQHRANLISVYKHNAELMKKVGNFVNAGDILAIVGNSGEMTDGPHLHFELWYNGNPVDPEEFVTF
jgi:murein DD-endopeptidase MepM/ murein hydrolase activator NlpD